jgi:23S rRNA (adenine2503-C2)-methyltransferase
MNFKIMESSNKNVCKYIFYDNSKIAESVLYKYNTFEERTVICCSVQSGCPVGCTFCGTGKNFIVNLTADEIIYQVQTILKDKGISDLASQYAKFQIMFMSMGEPMLNWTNVEIAIQKLNQLYPNAALLLSTIGVADDNVFKKIIDLSTKIDKVGLQFSIHKSTNNERNKLIPYNKKYTLREIRDRGTAWSIATKRQVYLNYCVDNYNTSPDDAENLKNLFSPINFCFTFSVICESDKDKLCEVVRNNKDNIENMLNTFISDGYNARIFDPAGQDDIGGGCGQLWFVKDWLKSYKGNGQCKQQN